MILALFTIWGSGGGVGRARLIGRAARARDRERDRGLSFHSLVQKRAASLSLVYGTDLELPQRGPSHSRTYSTMFGKNLFANLVTSVSLTTMALFALGYLQVVFFIGL